MSCLSPLPARFFLLLNLCTAAICAQDARFDSDSRTEGLAWGFGHSWKPGFFGQTETDIAFGAFHPQIGWFMTDKLELYGEGTLFVYGKPQTEVAGGLAGLSARYHFWNDRVWTPYVSVGSGLIWTTLDEVREIDRNFNFQLVQGIGVRLTPRSGPGWIFEFRNHHISNAGTAGENLGINAATVIVGLNWVVR